MYRLILFLVCLTTGVYHQEAMAQMRVHSICRQRSFPRTVPHANYSGIAYLGGQSYAVVDDKSVRDGFYIFEIKIDSITGQIENVERKEFRGTTFKNRDFEGIAYHSPSNSILISGEDDNQVLIYDTLGNYSERCLKLPQQYRELPKNLGLEALSCTPDGQTTFVANESSPCYITTFDHHFKEKGMYRFEIDNKQINSYLIGVSEICGLSDTTCLVLQREIFIPKQKIGSHVDCKIYYTKLINTGETIGYTQKTLIASWTTRLNLTTQSFANYEGMCLGPKLSGNRQSVILVSDSQAGYKGVLKDYFNSIVVEE